MKREKQTNVGKASTNKAKHHKRLEARSRDRIKECKELCPKVLQEKLGGVKLQVYFAVEESMRAKGWLTDKGEVREKANDTRPEMSAANVQLAKASDLRESDLSLQAKCIRIATGRASGLEDQKTCKT